MLENILKLKNAQKLKINEQKNILGKGGFEMCYCPNLGYTVDCSRYDQICPLDY